MSSFPKRKAVYTKSQTSCEARPRTNTILAALLLVAGCTNAHRPHNSVRLDGCFNATEEAAKRSIINANQQYSVNLVCLIQYLEGME